MNKIINKFLLAGDKFMPEMHLKQPRFTYSTCGPFTKNKEKIQKFKETGDTSYILKMNLIRLVFNMILLIELRDKAFNIAKNPKYGGYERSLASMVYKFFDKKSAGSGIVNNNDVNNDIKQNLQLAEELHKPIIKKFKKRRVYSGFKDNIWDAD